MRLTSTTDAFIERRCSKAVRAVQVMAIFGKEVLGRQVLDRTGAMLGTLSDIHFDLNTGTISDLIVTLEADLDATALPFEHRGQTVTIPVSHVARIAAKIQLNQ